MISSQPPTDRVFTWHHRAQRLISTLFATLALPTGAILFALSLMNVELVGAEMIESPIVTTELQVAATSVISAPNTVTGYEDTEIPLGIEIDDGVFSGGSQMNVIGTEVGYRAAGEGAISFTVPANASAIRITGSGGNPAEFKALEDEFQNISLVVNLSDQSYSGHIFFVQGGGKETADNYSFSQVPLGTASSSATDISGHYSNRLNAITLSLVGSNLTLSETQTMVDQAYLVEYLSAVGVSAELLNNEGVYLEAQTAEGEIAIPAEASFAMVTIQEGRGSDSPYDEEQGYSKFLLDLDANTASGFVALHTGRGMTQTVTYAFSGYDLSSGESVLENATVVGDRSADGAALQDYTLIRDGSLITLRRDSLDLTVLSSFIFFQRINETSSAFPIGNSQDTGSFYADAVTHTWELPFDAGAQSGFISMAKVNLVGGTGDNENVGTGQVFVDLVNGTTSGMFVVMRLNSPDLINWSNVPFGMPIFDHGETVSNKNSLNAFNDQFSPTMVFETIATEDGGQALQISAASAESGVKRWNTYEITMQAQWSGVEPVNLGVPSSDYTFSQGALNEETGLWEVNPNGLENLSITPAEHFSGDDLHVIVPFRGESVQINVEVIRVIDPLTVTLAYTETDVTGGRMIGDPIQHISLADQDGSESLVGMELRGLPAGTVLSDGVHHFTSTVGSRSIDVTEWHLDSLEYTPSADHPWVATITAAIRHEDTDNFSPSNAEMVTEAFFDVWIADLNGPAVVLNGPAELTIEVMTPFLDPGATCTDDRDLTCTVIIAGDAVDPSTVGVYTTTYNAIDLAGNSAAPQIRVVTVEDTTPPEIDLIGESTVSITLGEAFTDDGATCSDNYDLACEVSIGGDAVDSGSVGSYTVTYDAQDASGNSAIQQVRTVIVHDPEAPIITLNGEDLISIRVGERFIDPGASCVDNYDAMCAVIVGGDQVDSLNVGLYTITYDAIDSSSNAAVQRTRLVSVNDPIAPMITRFGEPLITLSVGQPRPNLGATCADNVDPTCAVVVGGDVVNMNRAGSYTITYDAVDAAGNRAVQVTQTVVVVDDQAPIIALNGDEAIEIVIGEPFVDPGAVCVDDNDSSCVVTVADSTVNAQSIGTYTITYSAIDSNGNVAEVTRTVTIRPHILYFTTMFVDG